MMFVMANEYRYRSFVRLLRNLHNIERKWAKSQRQKKSMEPIGQISAREWQTSAIVTVSLNLNGTSSTLLLSSMLICYGGWLFNANVVLSSPFLPLGSLNHSSNWLSHRGRFQISSIKLSIMEARNIVIKLSLIYLNSAHLSWMSLCAQASKECKRVKLMILAQSRMSTERVLE